MYTFTIVVEAEEDGYSVFVPLLPGCFSRGDTVEEASKNAEEAIALHIEGLKADGEPIPEEVVAPQLRKVTVAA